MDNKSAEESEFYKKIEACYRTTGAFLLKGCLQQISSISSQYLSFIRDSIMTQALKMKVSEDETSEDFTKFRVFFEKNLKNGLRDLITNSVYNIFWETIEDSKSNEETNKILFTNREYRYSLIFLMRIVNLGRI